MVWRGRSGVVWRGRSGVISSFNPPSCYHACAGTAGSKPAAGGVYSGAFSVRGPAGMVSLPTLATSGQPSSNGELVSVSVK